MITVWVLYELCQKKLNLNNNQGLIKEHFPNRIKFLVVSTANISIVKKDKVSRKWLYYYYNISSLVFLPLN